MVEFNWQRACGGHHRHVEESSATPTEPINSRLRDISFSIYLIHNAIIRLLIPFWVETLGDVGMTAALGEAGTYLLFSIVAWPILLCLSTMVFT